jgi:hypothetical protein
MGLPGARRRPGRRFRRETRRQVSRSTTADVLNAVVHESIHTIKVEAMLLELWMTYLQESKGAVPVSRSMYLSLAHEPERPDEIGTAEAAEILGLSVDDVRAMLRDGDLIGDRVPRGRWWLHRAYVYFLATQMLLSEMENG